MTTNYHNALSFGLSLSSANLNAKYSQLDSAITNFRDGSNSFNQINFNSFTSRTISSGAIVADKTLITVDTEAAAASDELDNLTSPASGDYMIIKIANAARTVVVRDTGGGTGNIRTPAGTNITLSLTTQLMMLVYNGTTWNVINDPTGGGSFAPTNATYITQTANGTLSAEQALSSLSTGLMKVTTATGVISTAVSGTDYAPAKKVAIIVDQKTTATDGGGASATTWNARDLNTEVSDADSIVSISSNKFVPISGTYLIIAEAPAYQCGAHRIRLYNVTAAAVVKEGISVRSSAADGISMCAKLTHRFTANGTDEYRIDHYTVTANAGDGLGIAVGDGSAERYLEIYLEKLA